MKGQLAVVNAPLLRKVEEFPFSAALFAAVIDGRSGCFHPRSFFGVSQMTWRVPDVPEDSRPTLQLFAAGGINHFIIISLSAIHI